MATITATGARSIVQPKLVHPGTFSMTGRIEFTASAGDVVQMVKVPAGFTVSELILTAAYSAADTIAGTVDCGDGNHLSRYLSETVTTVGASNIFRLGSGVINFEDYTYPYTYSANDTIDVIVGTTTGTASASKNITIGIIVTGSVDFQA